MMPQKGFRALLAEYREWIKYNHDALMRPSSFHRQGAGKRRAVGT
jgi:hypothetical protein